MHFVFLARRRKIQLSAIYINVAKSGKTAIFKTRRLGKVCLEIGFSFHLRKGFAFHIHRRRKSRTVFADKANGITVILKGFSVDLNGRGQTVRSRADADIHRIAARFLDMFFCRKVCFGNGFVMIFSAFGKADVKLHNIFLRKYAFLRVCAYVIVTYLSTTSQEKRKK